jgi:hypothetical protein
MFLLVLLPVLGVLLRRRRAAPAEAGTPLWKLAVGLLIACWVPYLSYCTLRAVTVGHFGLVSFGGRNLIGIAGQFMTPDLARRLPDDLRPVAVGFLERRKEIITHLWETKFTSYLATDWQPVPRRASGLNYQAVDKMYGPTINVYAYLLRALGCDDEARLNRELTRISRAVLRSYPTLYLAWVGKAFWNGLGTLVADTLSPRPLTLVAALLALFGLVHVVRTSWAGTPPGAAGVPGPAARALPVVFLIAVSFALSKLILVILVEVPIARYLDAAGVFLPAIPMAALVSRWGELPRPDRTAPGLEEVGPLRQTREAP